MLAELHQTFEYDQVTGEFYYKISTVGHVKPGDRAGTKTTDGYWGISFQNKKYRRGRLAFFYMKGRWPDPEIDHIDRNPLNDAWLNLREATSTDQKLNMNIRKDNTSGHKGVYWNKANQKWEAKVFVLGRQIRLGMFTELEDAIAARKAGEALHY